MYKFKILFSLFFILLINSLYSHEILLDSSGTISIDGKRIFIFGAYRSPDMDYKNFNGLQEAKFNMTHEYRFEVEEILNNQELQDKIDEAGEYLDLAEKAGVYVFMGIPRYIVGTKNIIALKNWVNALKMKPALLFWYLMDEPDSRENKQWVTKDLHKSMKTCYHTIKRIDPIHPVCFVGNRKDTAQKYKDTADLIWADSYSVPRNILNAYAFPVHYQAETQKPVWFVAGASSAILHLNRKLKVPERFHRPNAKEIRAQAHTAIAGGCQGLLYYWLPNDDIINENPTIWQAVVELGNELNVLNDVLTSTEKTPEVSIAAVYQDRGVFGSSKWTRNSGLSFSKLLTWTRSYRENLYIGIVNAGYDPMVKVTIQLPEGYSTDKVIQYPDEVVVAQKENGCWHYNWNILDVVIFEQTDSSITLIMNECDTVVFCFHKK